MMNEKLGVIIDKLQKTTSSDVAITMCDSVEYSMNNENQTVNIELGTIKINYRTVNSEQ